ncbi:hypothetical protein BSKO_12361 [Bryopsis sp. KO-2023]|nr:hypothetical protein BSKO_12361 [Bryopsis sp. KO-2023]
MDLEVYKKRFRAAQTFSQRQELYKDVFDADNTFRKLFSQQRESWVVPELGNPHQSLIPVYDDRDLFKCLAETPEEAAVPKVFALGSKRKPAGAHSIVTEGEFKRNFDELFTEGSLKYMNWDGVFAAGGSVMACMQPLPAKHDVNNRARRRFMHDEGFPGSDIDLFLYGMDAEQARKKIIDIYNGVREANPFDVLCFRSAHTITLVSEYPYRHIQIVLRLYSSPFEVIAGFDVDSCAVGYDGKKVWTTPRCHMALVAQSNPINLTRRSPTYEMRLAKYAKRGFEVPVPGLQKARIDPTLFERSWNKVVGLAKLLLLERLKTPEERFRYREQHRSKKMRQMCSSAFAHKFRMRGMIHNPWMAERLEAISARHGADASDYSTVFLPWGKGYNAQRCATLMNAKDRILNDRWISKGREYKLHPCFIGTAEFVVQDCAPNDPPIPEGVDEEELKGYVRGPLSFIEDDPGRQMIGSFHPTEDTDWSAGAYITVEMDSLSMAANANDIDTIKNMLNAGVSPNCTDFAGRTPLHITAFAGSVETAKLLLENGGRMIRRMADGRTVAHIVAMYGWTDLARLFLEKSKKNEEEKEEKDANQKENEKSDEEMKDKVEDEEDETPDILDLDAEEWNNKMTPLQIAMMFGHVEIVEILLENGADPNKGWPLGDQDDYNFEVAPCMSVAMTLASWNKEASRKLLKVMTDAGCDVARLDQSLRNILHMAACNGNAEFMDQILEIAPVMKTKAINVISLEKTTPLLAAITQYHQECVSVLLKHGARIEMTDADCDLARRRSGALHSTNWSVASRIREMSTLTVSKVEYPLWLAVRGVQNRVREVSEALAELAEEQQAASEGGRSSPKKAKWKDPFGIVKILIAHGAKVNWVNGDETVTMVDFVSGLLKSLDDMEEAEKKAKIEFLKQYERFPQSTGSSSVMDGFVISSETGLPATFKSQSKVRELLNSNKIPENSYVRPSLEARALELDAEALMMNVQQANGESREKQRKAYQDLLKILKDAGGLTYQELKRLPDQRDSSDDDEEGLRRRKRVPQTLVPEKLKPEIIISTYVQLPGRKEGRRGLSYFRSFGQRDPGGMLLEASKQPLYHALFEAVWNGDRAHVERMTIEAAPEERLLICSQNLYFQTPLTVALMRGHVDLAYRIIEIAALQYTPPKPQKKGKKKGGGQPIDNRLNNFAVELMVDEMGSDDDNDSEEPDSDMEDALLQEMQEMENEALMAAEQAAAAEAGVSADVGTEKTYICHTSPEDLLAHSSYVPADIVEAQLDDEWRYDIKTIIRLLWKVRQASSQEAMKTLKEKYNLHLETSWYYNRTETQGFRMVSPLMLALMMKRMDIVEMLLNACESWDGQWKDEAKARAKAKEAAEEDKMEEDEDNPPAAAGAAEEATKSPESPKEGEDDEEKDEVEKAEAGKKDCTKLACELVAAIAPSYGGTHIVYLLDDPLLLERLIERTGCGLQFANDLANLKPKKKKTKPKYVKYGGTDVCEMAVALMEVDGDEEVEEAGADFEDVSKPLRVTTMLHTATICQAKNITGWILAGSAKKAFKIFLESTEKSRSARMAERLGKLFMEKDYTGVSDQGSLEGALSAYCCGHLGMEDDSMKTVFHHAIGCHTVDMLRFILEQTKKLNVEEMAKVIVNRPRIVTVSKKAAFYHRYRNSSGTSPLQAAAFCGQSEALKLLLDYGADFTIPDGRSDRGWNILAFAVACQNHKSAMETVETLLKHPRLTPEVQTDFAGERMGDNKITPLMIAASIGNAKMVSLLGTLLPKGAFPWQAKGGRTALHIATRRPHSKQNLKVVEALLQGDQKRVKLDSGDNEQDVIKEEVAKAAASEDHVGLTPLDISVNMVCDNRKESTRPSRATRQSTLKEESGGQWDLQTYLAVRNANPSLKRNRPRFEDVQASMLQATEEASNQTYQMGVFGHNPNDTSDVLVNSNNDVTIIQKDNTKKTLNRTAGIGGN